MRTSWVIGILCSLFITINASTPGITIIKNPVPKFSGVTSAKTLVLDKSIEEIGDEEYQVFAGIQSVAVDTSGNYYLLDFKHATIIKMDRNFKFLRSIGRRGEGPGEFKMMTMTPNHVTVGLDDYLYAVNFMTRRIKKFTLDGKYIKDLVVDQFTGFKFIVDEKGELFLPSVRGHLIDVYNNEMKYKKSFLPGSDLKTFLFLKPPPCVTIKYATPGNINSTFNWLSSSDIFLVNQFDLSIKIIEPVTGKVKKKFYLWDDFILSEFKKEIQKSMEMMKNGVQCTYYTCFRSSFIDDQDNIFLGFLDTGFRSYLYKFSREGELIQVYKVAKAEIDGIPFFFQLKNGKFIGYTRYGIHIYKEKNKV